MQIKIVKILVLTLSSICFVLSVMVAGFKLFYPIDYLSQIKKYAKIYNLDESLVQSVIKVESGYNESAKSIKGARGLMQIMPLTADFIAGELGYENFNYNFLFDPEINIEMGCYYLNYLFEKYGDETKVLFCYNAGEGKLHELYARDAEIDVNRIEFQETRNYVKRVQKAKKVYKNMNTLI